MLWCKALRKPSASFSPIRRCITGSSYYRNFATVVTHKVNLMNDFAELTLKAFACKRLKLCFTECDGSNRTHKACSAERKTGQVVIFAEQEFIR